MFRFHATRWSVLPIVYAFFNIGFNSVSISKPPSPVPVYKQWVIHWTVTGALVGWEWAIWVASKNCRESRKASEKTSCSQADVKERYTQITKALKNDITTCLIRDTPGLPPFWYNFWRESPPDHQWSPSKTHRVSYTPLSPETESQNMRWDSKQDVYRVYLSKWILPFLLIDEECNTVYKNDSHYLYFDGWTRNGALSFAIADGFLLAFTYT